MGDARGAGGAGWRGKRAELCADIAVRRRDTVGVERAARILEEVYDCLA